MALKSLYSFQKVFVRQNKGLFETRNHGSRIPEHSSHTILFIGFCQVVLRRPHQMSHSLGIFGLKTEHSVKQCYVKYMLGITVHCDSEDIRNSFPLSPPLALGLKKNF